MNTQTTTEYPEGYQGNRNAPLLNVPKFDVRLRTVKIRHLPWTYHIENVSTFRKLSK